MKYEDIMLFAFIGLVVLYSCILYVKKCKRDMHRIRQLNMQVVPAVLVEEPYVHNCVPELP